MYSYKRIIKSGDMIEVEYYQSIRKIGKNYGGRKKNTSRTPEKMKALNKARAVKNVQRLINANFSAGDFFCRFSAPYGTFEGEADFRAEVARWFRRVRRRCEKAGEKFKYIAFIECGKSGKNWHIHIIVKKEIRAILQECWAWADGQNFTPLYRNENFKKLAEYITKDVCGNKRIMTSRNLDKPTSETVPAKRREVRKLERGEMLPPPEGYRLVEDDYSVSVNFITGAKWYFCYLPICENSGKKNSRG